MRTPLVTDELDLLRTRVALDQHPKVIELGCGAAQLSRQLLVRFPACEVTAQAGKREPIIDDRPSERLTRNHIVEFSTFPCI
jgi:trans-aconitate methyltransferase